MNAHTPWLEITQSGQNYQAIFAFQVCLQPFEILQKNRWGFNAAALLTEALDRQKLFIESQYHGNPFQEPTSNEQTLALRCIRIPEEGLLLALLGKVNAPGREEARTIALEYCNEIKSTFPHDYKIHPATQQETYNRLIGRDILKNCQAQKSIAQLLRFETPLRTQNGLVYIHGFWQTSDRSDEQIWRMLGNYPRPAMLNISLRPTILDSDERQFIWDMKKVSVPFESISPMHPPQPFDKWVEPFIERRLNPWKRYYLLQIHLLVPSGVTRSLIRAIGSTITRESPDLLSPGFLSVHPASDSAAQDWRAHIAGLEITPTHYNPSSLSRLSDIADLNEAHSVFRFPYPHETGLPEVKFIGPIEQ